MSFIKYVEKKVQYVEKKVQHYVYDMRVLVTVAPGEPTTQRATHPTTRDATVTNASQLNLLLT